MSAPAPRFRVELIPLLIACVLAPLAGGQITTDVLPLGGPILGEIFGGGSVPLLSQALVGLFIFAGLAWNDYGHKSTVLPRIPIMGAMAAFLALMLFSMALTPYGLQAYLQELYWLLLAAAFFYTVAASGRIIGARLVVTALVVGAAILSVKAIQEYGLMRRIEPTYRIFAGWSNPNALAGMLGLVLPASLSLVAGKVKWQQIVGAFAALLVTTALVLTQSKGGYLSTGVGVLVFAGCMVAWKQSKMIPATLVPVALGAVLAIGLVKTAAPAGGGAVLGHVTASAGTAEQSVGFRQNLWKGAVSLIRERPMGWGAGSYKFVSAKPGLTEQTALTHEVYLQVAVEGGVLAFIAFAATVALILKYGLAGITKLTADSHLLRAGVLGGLAASGVDFLIDSNLFFLGVGLCVFIYLGLVVQLAPDASSPEIQPPGFRLGLGVGLSLAVLVALVMAGANQLAKASFMTAVANKDAQGARESLTSLYAKYPDDPEVLYLYGMYGVPPEERANVLARAAQLEPSTKYLRALAIAREDAGKAADAEAALADALRLDPNNLLTLTGMEKLALKNGDDAMATDYARRIVGVEQTTYFKTRAIPEIVPTEPLEARVFLAARTTDRQERADLLQQAVDGYLLYASRTVPKIKEFAKEGMTFGGSNMEEAKKRLDGAIDAAKSLKAAYSALGERDKLPAVDVAIATLSAAEA